MSLPAIEQIMEDLRLDLSEPDKIALDEDLRMIFGLIGAVGHCEEVSMRWETDRERMTAFILKWVQKRKKKKEGNLAAIAEVM